MFYKTVEGDTWDILAKRFYKSEKLMDMLLDANPNLKDFVVFPAGVNVFIPEIDEEIKINVELPPWRK